MTTVDSFWLFFFLFLTYRNSDFFEYISNVFLLCASCAKQKKNVETRRTEFATKTTVFCVYILSFNTGNGHVIHCNYYTVLHVRNDCINGHYGSGIGHRNSATFTQLGVVG